MSSAVYFIDSCGKVIAMKDLKFKSIFDIIGPVMVGPSSSHTAGAAKIGKIARKLFGEEPSDVRVHLYGSFAKTYRGHGTDLAILGGVLGMTPDNVDLAHSLQVAKRKKIKVVFIPSSDEVPYPNTTKIELIKDDHHLSVTGESIGGGNIHISKIDDFKVNLTPGTNTYVIIQHDIPGMVASVSRMFSQNNINIATMTVSRSGEGDKALMIIEVDDVHKGMASQLRSFPGVISVNYFD